MPPTLLIEALEGLRRRVRMFSVAYGVGLVLAATVAGLLAFVLIDFVLHLGRAPRGMLLLSGLGALGYAIVRWIVRPAQAKLSINDIAGRVESVYPQFEDRLRSTVDFIRSGGASIPGSEPMKLATIAEASKRAEGIDFDRVVNPAPAWYSAGAAAGALVIIFALGFLLPRVYVSTALSRLGLGTAQWPKTVEIALLKDVPTRVPVGQRVDVQIRLAKGDKESRKAVIYYRYDDKSPWQQEVMKRGADGVYSSSLDARLDASKNAGNLQIRMVAGDDTKEIAPVAIVPRLDISRIVANVTAPAYAGSAKSSVNLAERAAVMPVGAGVELRVAFNKPLDSSHHVTLVPAEPSMKAPEVKWDLSGGSVASGTFEAGQSFRFSVGARDQDGFENTAAQQYELIVREDGMPAVQIEEPRRSEERTANAAFPLQAVAEDDYGIATAQLVVNRVGQASTASTTNPATQPAAAAEPNAQAVNKWVIPLVENASPVSSVSWEPAGASGDRKRYRLEHTWDLGKLPNANLKPGDVLEYFVQVKDNFKLGGREHEFVPSGKLRITIISAEQWQKLVQAEVEQIGQEIRQIKQGQARTRVETAELAKNAAERGKFDDADKAAAERLANQQGTTASQTMQSGQKLENLVRRMNENKSPEGGVKQTAKEVAERMAQIADGEMREAGKSINDAKDKKPLDPRTAKPEEQKKDAAERAAGLNKAAEQQNASEQKLQAAMDKLGDFSTLGDTIARIQDIADQQKKLGQEFNKNSKDNLGKKPEELSKDARDKNDQLSKEQDSLQQKTQKAMEDMNKKADDMKKSDAAKSQAMKDAAKAGENVPQQQQQNSQSMQQNQQAQAQQAQKKIELGLEQVLQKLKEAERRELEQLQKQLAELEQLVADLIKRQAGHNIDNLTVDNPKKLTDMTKDARDELMQLAGRDEKNQPAPPAQNELSPAQETTERNTRDVAKKAEELPNPAPATKLTAAAGQMERAIVHLRASKLGEAYEPPQVEALKALEEAAELVRKDLEEADKKLEEKDKETLRQQYVKLLEDQKKLDADTKAVHGKRDKDGNLPRAVAVQLNALPGVQGGLHERAAKLGEDLKSLKSIVYDWANREVARSMEDVKEQLGNRETGDVTQANQKKIEDQIAAMIENLKQTPPKPEKFASRNQGGGGAAGQQGKPPPPRVPTEAELRLLKSFQNGVKDLTKALDANKKRDPKETLALGGRQGELRDLLDEMVKQATQGKVSLGPEPDNKDQLPEEAKAGDVENQELDQELLGNGKDEPEADAVVDKIKKTGARMARSRQRLALNNDPGKVTQIIQERIALDIDELIKEANRQQQQSQASGRQKSKSGQQQQAQQNQQNQQQQPKPGDPQQQQAKAPAQSDPKSLEGAPPAEDLSKEIREKSEEWGKLFDRRREAVLEGGGQQEIRKYREFVRDYYRSLSEKGSDKR